MYRIDRVLLYKFCVKAIFVVSGRWKGIYVTPAMIDGVFPAVPARCLALCTVLFRIVVAVAQGTKRIWKQVAR